MNSKIRTAAAVIFAGLLVFSAGCGSNGGTAEVPDVQTTEAVKKTTAATEAATTKKTTKATTKKTTKATTKKVTTTTKAAPVLVETDRSAEAEVQSGGILVDFYNGACQMMFPSDWADRFIIRDGGVYSRLCWEKKEGTGCLFQINITQPDLHSLMGIPYYLLGSCSDGFVTWYTDQDSSFSVSDNDLVAEYNDLYNDFQSIIDSAVCETTGDQFSPVNMLNYAVDGDIPDYTGSWNDMDEQFQMMQATPYVIICDDGKFVYQYFSTIYEGQYLMNVVDPIGNEHPDGGPTGIAYLNGKLHEIYVYPFSPVTMSITNMYGIIPEVTKNSITCTYWSDSETYGLDEWMQ